MWLLGKLLLVIIAVGAIPRIIGIAFNLINQVLDQLTNITLFTNKKQNNQNNTEQQH